MRGRQLNTPCTTAVSGETSFLPPLGGGLYKTKSRQTLLFDQGGSKGRLRVCPFLGTWRALLSGELHVRARLEEAAAFFGGSMIRKS